MKSPFRAIRVQKLGRQEKETDLREYSPAELLAMMWQLALDAWAFKEAVTGEKDAQSRLPRHVVRVLRPAG
ncbi:MAG: hypothetical protein ACREAB_20055 [Blastocatellia bacterium]